MEISASHSGFLGTELTLKYATSSFESPVCRRYTVIYVITTHTHTQRTIYEDRKLSSLYDTTHKRIFYINCI